jgi:hypothetical protein
MRCGTSGQTQTSNTVSPASVPITLEESIYLDYSTVAGTQDLFSADCCARVLFFVKMKTMRRDIVTYTLYISKICYNFYGIQTCRNLFSTQLWLFMNLEP